MKLLTTTQFNSLRSAQKQRALNIISFLAAKVVDFQTAVGFRKWLYLSQQFTAREHAFKAKITTVVKQLRGRAVAVAWRKWNSNLRLRGLKVLAVGRMLRKLQFGTLKSAFERFARQCKAVMIRDEAKKNALQRLYNDLFLDNKNSTIYAFNLWCRKINLKLFAEYELLAASADKKSATKTICKVSERSERALRKARI